MSKKTKASPQKSLGRKWSGTLDQNLAANQRFVADTDPNKINLGVGTNVGSDGKPWNQATAFPTSLLKLVNSIGNLCGSYNPAKDVQQAAAEFILGRQLKLPSNIWSRCVTSFTAGGGSGAVGRAIDFVTAQHPDIRHLNLQRYAWVGYDSIAYNRGLGTKAIPIELTKLPRKGLAVLQTVHNGSGLLVPANNWKLAGRIFAKRDQPVILDIPYTGFDHAEFSYDEALSRSAEPLLTLVEAGAPVVVGYGPTKVFNTFNYRPGGATVVICRTEQEARYAQQRMTSNARGGTGFIDIATYALMKAMAENPEGLISDHSQIMQRLHQAKQDWATHAAGTPLGGFFNSSYGGLFRILPVQPGTVEALAEQHIHVVYLDKRLIRINIMGLPHSDRTEEIVQALSSRCTEGLPKALRPFGA
ncbi:MAG: aminotransferase class I/II-fold pyridoxal phosphate-dependent enzyme [Gammaproteobacteria bacterium]|nr:aminotransferase class I/II-fold pyridoxal phosphate-dependent enzyme [Gammaproteobacteria bacterium]